MTCRSVKTAKALGYVNFEMQQKIFEGIFYILLSNKAKLPNGRLINASRFNVLYANGFYEINSIPFKVTTNAFEAFKNYCQIVDRSKIIMGEQ